jgi:hypothetical protein
MDDVIQFLLKQLEIPLWYVRSTTLASIAHIVSTLESEVELKKSIIIASLTPVLGDRTIPV